MAEKAHRRLYAGTHGLEGGVDSGVAPHQVQTNQVSWAGNVTFRGGILRTRSGWHKRAIIYPNDDMRSLVNGAVWQAATSYLSDDNIGSILFAKGGRLYRISVEDDYRLEDVSATEAGADNLNYGWFVQPQAENYQVFQDGQSTPVIFNGAGSRRATLGEIKTGTVMAYQFGRIWYSVGTTGLAFRATDIVGGPSGTAGNRFRDAILKETENDYLNEGGDFSIPNSSGKITAMVAPAQLDTSLGQGPLQVFTTNAVFSVNAPVDRDIWKDVTYPIQTYSLIEKGAVGARFATGVNGDIWYRSEDGIRSFILARRSFSEWGNTPQSSEVTRAIESDNLALIQFGSSVLFDNRLLGTANPRVISNGSVVHSDLVVLDFNLNSGLRRKLNPAWEGTWYGLNILQIVTGRFGGINRCFMFTDNEGVLELWEITLDSEYDMPDMSTRTPVSAFIETRAFEFGSSNSLKRLDVASFFISDMFDRVTFSLKYKPDAYPCWVDWHDWSECNTVTQCLTFVNCRTCNTIRNYRPGYRPKMKVPVPADECDSTIGRPFREFFELQYRLEWSGQVELERSLVSAIELPEPAHGLCPGAEPCKAVECCVASEDYNSHGE